jgi:hypothetical protein
MSPSSSSSNRTAGRTGDSTTQPMQSKQQQQQPLLTLEILRVANQEISSGSKSGAVFFQLSKGAVAWPLERPVAQARIQRHIQALIDADEIAFSKPNNNNK